MMYFMNEEEETEEEYENGSIKYIDRFSSLQRELYNLKLNKRAYLDDSLKRSKQTQNLITKLERERATMERSLLVGKRSALVSVDSRIEKDNEIYSSLRSLQPIDESRVFKLQAQKREYEKKIQKHKSTLAGIISLIELVKVKALERRRTIGGINVVEDTTRQLKRKKNMMSSKIASFAIQVNSQLGRNERSRADIARVKYDIESKSDEIEKIQDSISNLRDRINRSVAYLSDICREMKKKKAERLLVERSVSELNQQKEDLMLKAGEVSTKIEESLAKAMELKREVEMFDDAGLISEKNLTETEDLPSTTYTLPTNSSFEDTEEVVSLKKKVRELWEQVSRKKELLMANKAETISLIEALYKSMKGGTIASDEETVLLDERMFLRFLVEYKR